mgnify:CR=1 FL=1
MKKIIELIASKNWHGILAFSSNMPEAERHKVIDFVKSLDVNKDIIKQEPPEFQKNREAHRAFYDNRYIVDHCKSYTLVTLTRNHEDLQRIVTKHQYGEYHPLRALLTSKFYQPIIDFFSQHPTGYFEDFIAKTSDRINFKMLWKFYELGWFKFDERTFVFNLFTLNGFENDHFEDTDFMMENPEIIDKVFLQFYKYEIPVLDLIKAKSIDYSNGLSAKANVYWTEAFKVLLEKNALRDREIVSHLFQSLLNNWKKPHLDWHVRLLEILTPTSEELIVNQATIFSVLGTGQPSLINYAIQLIGQIHQLKEFDREAFLVNFTVIFTNEKTTKAIISGLAMLESLFKDKQPDLSYRESLVMLLMSTDAKVQDKTAQILVKYFDDAQLQEVIAPYSSFFKQKAKDILQVTDTMAATESLSDYDQQNVKAAAIVLPQTWEELLLHIGTCIRTVSARDLDVFFEALIQLQDEIPKDFIKQLKPYTKQLASRFWETSTMIDFAHFAEIWVNGVKPAFEEKSLHPAPFFREKILLTFERLSSKSKTTLLSTPTHEPFFVHPSILLEKLAQYESEKKDINIEDLIVACNRVLLSEINDECAKKSALLKGNYAKAIQYLMGAGDKIDFTKDTLPLWTQVARIKSPHGVFNEFAKTNVANVKSIVQPANFDFAIETQHSENGNYKWVRLILEGEWNYSRWYKPTETDKKLRLHYNAGAFANAHRADFNYQLALNPQYLDAQLCRYVPLYGTGNEVSEQEDALYPMQFLLDHQLKVFKGGWIYVSACLLFEKKVSRDLGAEYIQMAMSLGYDTTHLPFVIGKMIALNYVPVNRLIEYLDKPNMFAEIKNLQFEMLNQCILQLDKEKLPTNSKKLKTYLDEFVSALGKELSTEVLAKIKELKWK